MLKCICSFIEKKKHVLTRSRVFQPLTKRLANLSEQYDLFSKFRIFFEFAFIVDLRHCVPGPVVAEKIRKNIISVDCI